MSDPTPNAAKVTLPEPLPETLAACHELLIKFWHRILELEKQVRGRNRTIHGPTSGRVNIDDIEGEGKEVYEKTCQTIEAEQARLPQPPSPERGGGGRKAPQAAKDEATEEHRINDATALLCPCCNIMRTAIGFTVSNQLDYIPARYKRIKHIEYSYACPKCKEHVITATKPLKPIDKGYPTPGLVTHIIQSKLDYHLPLYRQERILLSHGILISRSTMSRWLKAAADELRILYERMHGRILQCRVIESDETTMPFIRKGAGKTIKGKISVYRGDKTAPYNLYNFTQDGKGDNHKKALPGYLGFLLTDGTSVYNQVLANIKENRIGATAANCWAHVYRYFEVAKKADEKLADYALGVIKSMFKIDSLAVTLPEADCVALRQRLTRPILDDFKRWLDQQQISADPTSFADAVQYTRNHWDALCQFINHGFLKMQYNTGARVSELLDLHVTDVKIAGGCSSVRLHGKGRKQRVVPLWKETAILVRQWILRQSLTPDRVLLPNRQGTRMTRSNVAQRLALAIAAAIPSCPTLKGRQITPHNRHSTAMHMLQSGVDITVIALWLGHESPVTTHGYLEADLEMKRRAINTVDPPRSGKNRYKPSDSLLGFLENL